MSTQIQAVYENGVLRPLQPLALEEQQRVTITIDNVEATRPSDSAYFVLSLDRWEAFCQMLDRPPRDIPALRQLFAQPPD